MNRVEAEPQPLGRLVELTRETVSPREITDGTHYVGLEDIVGETGEISRRTVGADELKSGKFAFSAQHVLYGKLRPNLRKIARPDFAGICSTDILPILPSAGVDRGFLYHWLRRPSVVATVSMRTTGINLPRISPKRLLELEVQLPPLPEQRRIAELLDRADAVRRKREESRRLVDELLRSVFLEMFGDPVSNEKGWEVVRLGEVVAESQYGTGKRANSEHHGLPVLRMSNITATGEIDTTDMKWVPLDAEELTKFTVQRGDLLFNRTNSPELVGKSAVWDRDDEWSYAGYLIRVRFQQNRATPDYVSAFLNSAHGKQLLRESAKPSNNMSNISATEFKRLGIPLPPVEIQERYSLLRRRHVAELIDTIDRAANLSTELVAACMARLSMA